MCSTKSIGGIGANFSFITLQCLYQWLSNVRRRCIFKLLCCPLSYLNAWIFEEWNNSISTRAFVTMKLTNSCDAYGWIVVLKHREQFLETRRFSHMANSNI